MKKQENRPKLVLKKETIARLNNFGMQGIYGGNDYTNSNVVEACTQNLTVTQGVTRVGETCVAGMCLD